MKIIPNKSIPLSKLFVDFALNSRILGGSYKVDEMKEGIYRLGRITDQLSVEAFGDEDKYRVLKGNRRTLAAIEIVKELDEKLLVLDAVAKARELTGPEQEDKAKLEILRKNLEKLSCVVYEGLSDRERYELVFDQGGQRSLSRAETLMSVWRLAKEGFSPREIATALWTCLANFTKSLDDLSNKLANVKNQSERDTLIKKHFHGTLDNYMLNANAMGQFIKDQVFLTELAKDRPLTDEEKAKKQFDASRVRVGALYSARKKDMDAGKWDAENSTGPEFQALVDKYIAEDNGGTKEPPRPTAKYVRENVASGMKSKSARAFTLRAIGDKPEGLPSNEELDTEIFRCESVIPTVIAALDTIKSAEVKALLTAIAYKGVKEVNECLVPFTK